MTLERLTSRITPGIGRVLERALEGQELSAEEAVLLLSAEGPDFHALCQVADIARQDDNGDDVSYVVCRNINFTNVCYIGCSFCGFARHKDDADEAFDHPMSKILEKCHDAVARGASEVCIQGGIHPNKDHTHYHEILTAVKAELPDLHIHAYSPEEIDFGHKKSGMELHDYFRWLQDARLGTIPGTAA